MEVRRAIIDLIDCPDNTINRHLSGTGIEYANYHHAAYQIFIVESLPLQASIDKIDTFFADHAKTLFALHFDDSDGETEYPKARLVIELCSEATITDVVIPQRLISNLDRTGIPLYFDRIQLNGCDGSRTAEQSNAPKPPSGVCSEVESFAAAR